jgi:hypothetical protein
LPGTNTFSVMKKTNFVSFTLSGWSGLACLGPPLDRQGQLLVRQVRGKGTKLGEGEGSKLGEGERD